MNLIMVRHGEIPSNINKIYVGRSPEKLTYKGVQQAHEVADKLADCNIEVIYTSPIQRAVQTAEIIKKKLDVNLKINTAFRELEMGPWEGMSEAEIAIEFPEEWGIWNSEPAKLRLEGREPLDVLLERVLAGVSNINKDHSGGNAVIVTHVAIIRVLMLWHSKRSLNIYKTIYVPNAEIFSLSIDSSQF